jgi:hypothetical protein
MSAIQSLDLEQRFRAGLRQRLGELRDLLDANTDAETVMSRFHRLAGFGGADAFPQIADVSRECEITCRPAVNQNRPFRPEELESLRRGIDAIGETEFDLSIAPYVRICAVVPNLEGVLTRSHDRFPPADSDRRR